MITGWFTMGCFAGFLAGTVYTGDWWTVLSLCAAYLLGLFGAAVWRVVTAADENIGYGDSA